MVKLGSVIVVEVDSNCEVFIMIKGKNNKANKAKKQTNIKKSLPSGTVTTTRSSIFELGNSNKFKRN